MDRDALRNLLVAGIDRILSSWLLKKQLSDQEIAVLQAQRRLFLTDNDVLDKILAAMQKG